VTIEDEHGTIVFAWTTASNSNFQDVTGVVYTVSAGSSSLALNLNSVTTVGSVGTIQVEYEALTANDTFDSNFYQCIDVTIVAAKTGGGSSPATGSTSLLQDSFLWQLKKRALLG